MKGILLVDKPVGLTSHDVVDRIRRAAAIRRVGHTGTLDPAATGLLILCVGAATRLSEFLTGLDKVYEGSMQLGIVTDSYDMDGDILEERPLPELTTDDVQGAFDQLTGDIMQTPPMISAVKIGGQRLYKLARKGETVERTPRPVTVHEFRLLKYSPPYAQFRVRCTRGTYARALCYDVGELLGCGATLAQLRRTWVGHHSVANALPVDAFITKEDVLKSLLPVEQALDLPEVVVRGHSRKTVLCGGALGRPDLTNPCSVREGWVQVKAESGELLALGEVHSTPAGVQVQPRRVIGAPS